MSETTINYPSSYIKFARYCEKANEPKVFRKMKRFYDKYFSTKLDRRNNNLIRNYCFNKLLELGHTEVAKWLYYVEQDPKKRLSIRANNDAAFLTCVTTQNMEGMAWLYYLEDAYEVIQDEDTCEILHWSIRD